MPLGLSPFAQQHLEQVKEHFSCRQPPLGRIGHWYRRALARRLRELIPVEASVLEVGCGEGDLLIELGRENVTGVDLSEAAIEQARHKVPRGVFQVSAGESLQLGRTFDVILLSDTLNLAADVQLLLERLRDHSHPRTRLVLTFQNHLWRPWVNAAERLGLKRRMPSNNWLSRTDVQGLLSVADWETVNSWQEWVCPLPLGGIEALPNRFLTPLFEPLGLMVWLVARPRPEHHEANLSVSVVVPVRNEKGNIEAAVARLPEMGGATEVIFVEGGSTDGTWEEIQRVRALYPNRRLQAVRQRGLGKGAAVREGVALATADVVMILDGDLTVPPEELPKFYAVLASGRAEMANGSRLVYPMEKKAMRFLNMCANKIFALGFTWLLGQPVKDTLCGTKAFRRADYEKMMQPREGDRDPFGDFDLLLGACRLNLKIVDIPVRYCDRTYGVTKIHRWRHGYQLLRLALRAARKLKFAG